MGPGPAETLGRSEVRHAGYTVTPGHRFPGLAEWNVSGRIQPAQHGLPGKHQWIYRNLMWKFHCC